MDFDYFLYVSFDVEINYYSPATAQQKVLILKGQVSLKTKKKGAVGETN